MRSLTGIVLIGIGVLHTLIGVFTGRAVLSQIAAANFSSEASRQLVASLGKQFAFWFLFGGVVLMLLGHLCLWIERKLSMPVPAFMGWELVIISACGLMFMPVSGFWLVLAVAIYVLVTARRTRRAADATS